MSLTYGMIADRLSDLVAEISEYNGETTDYHKASEMARIIGELENVRERCDERSFTQVTILPRIETQAEITAMKNEDPGNWVVWRDLGCMAIACPPCAVNQSRLYGLTINRTNEHGVCQFCGKDN